MYKLSQIYTTIFFIGYIKWAPGSFGSLIALTVIIILSKTINYIVFILLFIFLLILAIKLIDIYTKKNKLKDVKEIIIDEFLGIYLIIIFSQNLNSFNEFVKIFLIFILFRFFDITKIYPAKWIDRNMNDSYGIILDDIIASFYTIIILYLINAFI